MAIAVVRAFVNQTRSVQSSVATQFLRLAAVMLACAVAVAARGSPKPSATTTSVVRSATSESTLPGRTLREWLAGRTFDVARPDGTFPTRILRPASTLMFALIGNGNESGNFISGDIACNSVGHVGSLEGDHLIITESSSTLVGCSHEGLDGLGWFGPFDARLALSDDGSTVTVTASETGKVVNFLLDPARFPVAEGASLVGTYQLTPKRLLVLDQDGTGRIIDAVSHVATCPVAWRPPPSLSIAAGDCPDDAELQNSFRPSLTASGDVRQRGATLFVGSLAFTKTTPAPPPTPASDQLANWPARPDRTFTLGDVPVLLPADRHGNYSVVDGDFTFAAPPPPSGDHFAQYLVNTTNPSDLVVVDTSLGNASFDGLGDPIVAKGWRGAWSGDRTVTLLSESGRVVVTGSTTRQQVGLLTRRATGAGWDLPGYSPMFEGWRYVSKARSILIDADDFKASIRVTVGGPEVQLFELIGPKLKRIEVKGSPASSIESIGTWDVTWSPAPDVVVTVSYSVPGPNFDYDAFEALRPAAEAFAQSVQPATPEELESLLAR
jgi:hypothetical protein